MEVNHTDYNQTHTYSSVLIAVSVPWLMMSPLSPRTACQNCHGPSSEASAPFTPCHRA